MDFTLFKSKITTVISLLFCFISYIFINSLLTSCSSTNEPGNEAEIDHTKVPEGFPPIPFPENNPITSAKVELGRMLFYEPLLSRDINIPSCSHCMKQEHSFSDNTRISHGNDNEPEARNTMSLVNVAYRKKLFWDGRGTKIEAPAYRSLFLPYILGADTNEIVRRLEQHSKYPKMFKKAFGDTAKPSAYLISLAIATFVRTLVSGNSPYDKYIRGDSNALTESQKRGMHLFFSERARCSVCHTGLFFTDSLFHNTGASSHYFDKGRFNITGRIDDWGKFLTPTLRNVEVNPPYMHDGIIPTLEDVIEHYNKGGLYAAFNKDTILRKMNISVREKTDLINFLNALTDWEFIKNSRFSKP